MTNLEAALKYLSKGWPIFPVNPTSKKPCLDSWKDYQNRLPPVNEIEEWWTRWPWANIGLVTGKLSGVSVVDIDPRHGGMTDNLPDTVQSQTGGGGWHYFYQYNVEVHSQNGIQKGVDLKSDGGYVILPPSEHKSGNKYKWITPPFVNEFAPLPEWIIQFQSNAKSSGAFDWSSAPGQPEGSRDEILYRAADSLAAKGINEKTTFQILRGLNQTFEPPLEETVVLEKLKNAFDFVTKTNQEIKQELKNPENPWPTPLDEAAYYGLAGDIIKAIEPHSEADPIALLMNFLTAFGSIIGDKPHFRVEGDKHPGRLFTVLAGKTAKARKGTSWGHLRNIFSGLDESWADNIQSGLSTGEGLVWVVRDPIEKPADPGVEDKRVLVVEGEFVRTLKVMEREGNTLSSVIRSAWDTGTLRILTKNSPAKATGVHISIIGHITVEELNHSLSVTETINGFGNRFLWCCVKRSKVLPRGGNISSVNLGPLINELRDAISFAQTVDEITWADETIPLWDFIYPDLSEGEPGLVGSMTARSEAYVIRLALLYALLDKSRIIKPEHLKAALAVWDYCEASVRHIFQDKTSDPLANKIIEAFSYKPEGMSREEIRKFFSGHKSSEEITDALKRLENLGRIKYETLKTSGRDAAIYKLSTHTTLITQEKSYLKKLNEFSNQLGLKDDLGTLGGLSNGVESVITPDTSGTELPDSQEASQLEKKEGGKYDWI